MLSNKVLYYPKGLYFLVLIEMWEKFSFFGMRSLLVYYMTKYLLFEEASASSIYGIYTGLVYFTPIIGGVLGDHYLNRPTTVVVGSVLMVIGYFLMMFKSLFYSALLLLILGVGVFAPNISPLIFALYKKGDYRSNHAFNIVYLGINVGAMLAPLVCGTIGEFYGWHYGFAAAGVGMLVGLIIYLTGWKYLPNNTGMIKDCSDIIESNNNSDLISSKKSRKFTTQNKFIGFLILIIFGVLFHAVYNQQGNTLAMGRFLYK